MPQGPFDAARQWLLFGGAYYVYRIVRGMVDAEGGAAAAFENARDLIALERGLGLFVEPAAHQWASSNQLVIDFASWMYVNSHFVITMTFLIWLYIARNHAYYFVRNMFIVAMALALVGYVAYPTAPPRFFPELGFTDSVEAFVGGETAAAVSVLYNPYAAVPSMHVAFALMLAVPAMRIVRARALKVAWALYPGLVTFVVVVTANHFWLDAALGAAVAAVSAWVAHVALARVRPGAWAWRREPAELTT